MNTQSSNVQQDQVNGPAMTGHDAKAPTPQKCKIIATIVHISITPIIILLLCVDLVCCLTHDVVNSIQKYSDRDMDSLYEFR